MPKISKSLMWTHSSNNIIIAQAAVIDSMRLIWLTVKNTLVDTFGWTVISSSSGSGGSASNSDLWLAPGNLQWNGSTNPRSWIVLANQAGQQICIALDIVTNTYQGSIVFSWGAGFTGGTLNARPTATDQAVLIQATTIFKNSTIQRSISIMQNSTNTSTRILVMSGNTHEMYLALDNLANPNAQLLPNAIVTFLPSSKTMTYAQLIRAQNVYAYANNTNVTAYLTCEGANGLGLGEIWSSNDTEGELPNIPARVIVPGVTVRRLGDMQDFWFGPTESVNIGDTYPNEAGTPRQFVQIGHVILPWDGSIPITA